MTACMEHLHRRWIQGEFSLPTDGGKKIQTNCVSSKEDMQQAAEADTLAQESLAFDTSEGVAALFLSTPTFEVRTNFTPRGNLLLLQEIFYPAS